MALGFAHQLFVIGVGPGSPEYLLPVAREKIEKGTIFVGGKRLLDSFAPEKDNKFYLKNNLSQAMNFIIQALHHDDVFVLVSGDPGYYSFLGTLRKKLPGEMITVIPGISALQLAFARLSLPWQNASFLSFHGRVPEERTLLYEKGRLLGTLTDSVHNVYWIAGCLLEHHWPSDVICFICSQLSYADERIERTTLGDLAHLSYENAKSKHSSCFSNCVMIVKG